VGWRPAGLGWRDGAGGAETSDNGVEGHSGSGGVTGLSGGGPVGGGGSVGSKNSSVCDCWGCGTGSRYLPRFSYRGI
jgi:hypothetical protein